MHARRKHDDRRNHNHQKRARRLIHVLVTRRQSKQIIFLSVFADAAEPPSCRRPSSPAGSRALLPRLAESLKRRAMKRIFDMDDRARLRERFFGATHTVLARL